MKPVERRLEVGEAAEHRAVLDIVSILKNLKRAEENVM